MRNSDGGFIQLIVILILILVVLSLLGVNLSAVFQNRLLRDNFSIAWKGVIYLWDNYISYPAAVVWNFISAIFRSIFSPWLSNVEQKVTPQK